MTNISPEFLSNLVQLLSDDALQQLGKAVNSEEVRRAFDQVKASKYTPLSEKEKQLLANGYKIEAIKQYRERVNCSVHFAKTVIEEHWIPGRMSVNCEIYPSNNS